MLIQATKSPLFPMALNATLPSSWLIEPPLSAIATPSALNALIRSRHILLKITTLCSSILCAHILVSAVRHAKFAAVGRSDTVPISEFSRSVLFIFVVVVTTSILVSVGAATSRYHIWHPWAGLLPELNVFRLVPDDLI